MSLRNVDASQTETQAEQMETVQQAMPAFPLYSAIIIGCLVLVYCFQIKADGNSNFIAGGDNSIFLAGFDKPAFISGQYWRIFTGFTLHSGLMHLFFNCYAIYVLGKLVETLSNRAHLANIFPLAAIGGNILSLIFLPDGISVGASGGVTGFLGYLAVYGYKRRAILSNDFLKNMLFNIGFLALYGIVLYQKIDNFGHLGGLLTGAIYGFIQISGDVYKDPRNISPKIKSAGLIALGITILISIFSVLVLSKII
ncbi:MAG: rhomboid family intramembrane serine protease [Pyrinomonadaceae bacterium]